VKTVTLLHASRRRLDHVRQGLVALLLVVVASPAAAQETRLDSLYRSIDWTEGPATTPIGYVAQFEIPSGCRFTSQQGAKAFMEANENPVAGNEEAVLVCPTRDAQSGWFVLFSYDPSGYVRDDERTSLDAGRILAALRKGNAEANRERLKRGWDTLHIVGWTRAPYYDQVTNNLTWATDVSSSNEHSVNHSVRLLGRGGVMHLDLVLDPAQLVEAVPEFDKVIASTSFTSGNTYSEWRDGDKVAAYGLTALIAGGAGATAVKLGLFGKLWKVLAAFAVAIWKLLVVAAIAVAGWIRSLFSRKSRQSNSVQPYRGG
jgi:uncharacterized membrane-anchored protein